MCARLGPLPYAALDLLKHCGTADKVGRVIYQNPIRFMGQSPKFKEASPRES